MDELSLRRAGKREEHTASGVIITESLKAASARIATHDVTGAVDVLEAALERLTRTIPNQVTPVAPMAWRVETVLSALYRSLGKKDHARRFAQVAFHHALRTGCPIAKARTAELLGEITSVPPPQLARGSRDFTSAPRSTPLLTGSSRITRGSSPQPPATSSSPRIPLDSSPPRVTRGSAPPPAITRSRITRTSSPPPPITSSAPRAARGSGEFRAGPVGAFGTRRRGVI